MPWRRRRRVGSRMMESELVWICSRRCRIMTISTQIFSTKSSGSFCVRHFYRVQRKSRPTTPVHQTPTNPTRQEKPKWRKMSEWHLRNTGHHCRRVDGEKTRKCSTSARISLCFFQTVHFQKIHPIHTLPAWHSYSTCLTSTFVSDKGRTAIDFSELVEKIAGPDGLLSALISGERISTGIIRGRCRPSGTWKF